MPNTDVLILCGGLGTRLKSVVSDVPKAMAPINGRPFLDYLLSYYREQGFHRFVLGTGFKSDIIEDYADSQTAPTLSLTISKEPHPLGTGGAIQLARTHLKSDPIIVLNGDSFCDADLNDVLATHNNEQANATLVLTEVEDCSRYGAVTLDGHQITHFQEKKVHLGKGWINGGIYVLSQSVLDAYFNQPGPFSIEKDVFPDLTKETLVGYKSPRKHFIDIGTPDSFELAQSFFQNAH